MSARPLYRGVDQALPAIKLQPGMHAGLWYDKFYRALGTDADKEARQTWIETVTGARIGDATQLREIIGRRRRMVELTGGRLLHLRATTRFVTGLGRAHPVENGFAWHHTLGTPYLPGSSIKGLVRAWARAATEDPELIDALLGAGPGRDGEPGHVGAVSFIEGVPTDIAGLEMDVMTPHQGAYYQRGEAPGDWNSPVPIPFLTCSPGMILQIGVVAHARSERAPAARAVDVAAGWLVAAMRELGAGAKTAVGYGRFEPEDGGKLGAGWVADLAARRQARATPLDRARQEVTALNEQQAYELVGRLSRGSENRTAEEREALRAALAERYLETWTKKGRQNVNPKKLRPYLAWLRGES
jgi:CRISPR-associated protein Cmr6